MTAPAPSRATASVVISWGLINIPVSLYTATEETRVPRKEFTKTGNAVGRQPYDKVTNEPVNHDDIVKKAQASNGEWVELTDQEIGNCTVDQAGVAAIEALVPTSSIGTFLVPQKLYQARPKNTKKAGEQAAADESFSLLLSALERRGEAALLKVSIRNGAAKYAALLPTGDLYVVEYADAVREPRPLPEVELSDQHLDLADTLLDQIGTTVPDLTNTVATDVQSFVDAKAGGETPVPATPETNATDLMESLMASVKATKQEQKA